MTSVAQKRLAALSSIVLMCGAAGVFAAGLTEPLRLRVAMANFAAVVLLIAVSLANRRRQEERVGAGRGPPRSAISGWRWRPDSTPAWARRSWCMSSGIDWRD